MRSVYVGSGYVVELGAELDETAAQRRVLERLDLRLTLALFDAALDALRSAEAELRTLRDGYLVATGHRQHRGQWRRSVRNVSKLNSGVWT